jgi:chromosome segregation ATPase
MSRGKHKNISNRNQSYLATSESSYPTTASPDLNTQDSDLNSHLMKMVEDVKEDINNFLKETQENTSKQVEDIKGETHKSLKEIQENTMKQVKDLNKTIQDLKMEIETLKKTQRETPLEMGNVRKRKGVTDASITNRIQEIEERILAVEYTIKNTHTTLKENTRRKRLLTQNIQEIQDTMYCWCQEVLANKSLINIAVS